MSFKKYIADKLSTTPAGYATGAVARALRSKSWKPLGQFASMNRTKDKSIKAQGMKWAGLAAGFTVPVTGGGAVKNIKVKTHTMLNRKGGPLDMTMKRARSLNVPHVLNTQRNLSSAWRKAVRLDRIKQGLKP